MNSFQDHTGVKARTKTRIFVHLFIHSLTHSSSKALLMIYILGIEDAEIKDNPVP